jgi:enoyl-CoA hydratase/carnithine racemase
MKHIFKEFNGEVAVRTACEGVAIVTINRPERRNALNMEVKTRIADAITALTAENSIRVIILTGAGRYFVAGTDIAEMLSMTSTDHINLETDRVFKTLRKCPKILMAAVEGYALGGGCELALCCDMIIAGENAKFGQPEIKVGIMPGAGGTQILARSMGKFRAMQLALTGEHFSAAEAFGAGLLSEVVADETALEKAIIVAQSIVAMPPLSVTAIKEVMNLGMEAPLDMALALERRAFIQLFDTKDQKEGMQAFLEKRPAHFSGV